MKQFIASVAAAILVFTILIGTCFAAAAPAATPAETSDVVSVAP